MAVQDISEDIQDALAESVTGGEQKGNVQTIQILDSSSKISEVLAPEFGSDSDLQSEGRTDVRRFTNVEVGDIWPLTWLSCIPKEYGGRFAKNLCLMYANWSYSKRGEHKKLVIEMERASIGKDKAEVKDKRKWYQRHITQRGKPKPEYFDIT